MLSYFSDSKSNILVYIKPKYLIGNISTLMTITYNQSNRKLNSKHIIA